MEVQQRRLCKVRRNLHAQPASTHSIDKGWGRKELLWTRGTTINWCFVPNTSLDTPQQRQNVVQAWKKWADTGLGLTFKQLDWKNRSKCQVRIAFREFDENGLDEGSYSYVGTDNLQIPKNEHTMNLGWNLSLQPGTAEHEIGHALGLDHEHQHPKCLLVWDEEKVIEQYMKEQGWTRDDVIEQVIKRISAPFTGTSWDSHSIMHYEFDKKLIKAPPEFVKNGIPYNEKITTHDVECILKMYPRVVRDIAHKPVESEPEKPESDQPIPETLPKLEIWKTIQLSPTEDSIYSLTPDKSGQYEIISHGFAQILVVVDVIVSKQKSHLFGGKVNNDKRIPITLIADENVEYILTFRVIETRKTGNFSLLIVEKDGVD